MTLARIDYRNRSHGPVPELTRNASIQLNDRVSLRWSAIAIALIGTGYCPAPDQAKPPGDHTPPGGLCLNDRPRMPSRLQKYFWRSLDRAMPDGPPIFLLLVIAFLLVVNGFVAIFRPI